MQEHLDRALSSASWQAFFPSVRVHNFFFSQFDHDVVEAVFEGLSSQQNREWRFERMWTLVDKCETVVHDVWQYGFVLSDRLGVARHCLLRWNREEFSGLHNRINYLQDEIGGLCNSSDSKAFECRKFLTAELGGLLEQEEVNWSLRACQN